MELDRFFELIGIRLGDQIDRASEVLAREPSNEDENVDDLVMYFYNIGAKDPIIVVALRDSKKIYSIRINQEHLGLLEQKGVRDSRLKSISWSRQQLRNSFGREKDSGATWVSFAHKRGDDRLTLNFTCPRREDEACEGIWLTWHVRSGQ